MAVINLRKVYYKYNQILAPTSYAALTNILYGRRPTGRAIISACGAGRIAVYTQADSATLTWNLNYANQPNLTDLNSETYAGYWVPGNQAETDAVIANYGSVAERFIVFRVGTNSSGSTLTHRLYISNDGATWTKILETNVTTPPQTFIQKQTFRYLKVTVQNTSSTGYESRLYELTAFATTGGVFNRNLTVNDETVNFEGLMSVYCVFVDPVGNLMVSIHEKGSVTGVDSMEVESS